jgi:hypothetical protein
MVMAMTSKTGIVSVIAVYYQTVGVVRLLVKMDNAWWKNQLTKALTLLALLRSSVLRLW